MYNWNKLSEIDEYPENFFNIEIGKEKQYLDESVDIKYMEDAISFISSFNDYESCMKKIDDIELKGFDVEMLTRHIIDEKEVIFFKGYKEWDYELSIFRSKNKLVCVGQRCGHPFIITNEIIYQCSDGSCPDMLDTNYLEDSKKFLIEAGEGKY